MRPARAPLDSEARALQMLSKLRGMSKQTKARRKRSDHADLWVEELRRMRESERALEKDLRKSVELFAATEHEEAQKRLRAGLAVAPAEADDDDECPVALPPSSFVEMGKWLRAQRAGRRALCSQLQEQVRTARTVAAETRKALREDSEEAGRAARVAEEVLGEVRDDLAQDSATLAFWTEADRKAMLELRNRRSSAAASSEGGDGPTAALVGERLERQAWLAAGAGQVRLARSTDQAVKQGATTVSKVLQWTSKQVAQLVLPSEGEEEPVVWCADRANCIVPSEAGVLRVAQSVCETVGSIRCGGDSERALEAACDAFEDGAEGVSEALARGRQRVVDALLEWSAFCAEIGTAAWHPRGGWGRDEHASFVRVLRLSRNKGLASRMELEVPHRSPEQVREHEAWWSRRDKLFEGVRSACTRAAGAISSVLEDMGARVVAVLEQRVTEDGRVSRAQEIEQERWKRHTKLQRLRRLRRLREEQEDARQAQAAASSMAERVVQEHAEDRARASAHDSLLEWKTQLSLVEARHAEAKRRVEEHEAMVREAVQEYRKDRIEHRALLLQERTAERDAAVLALREEEEARSKALEELKATLPYAEALEAIQPDAERVSSHTAASRIASDIGSAHAAFLREGGMQGLRALPLTSEGDSDTHQDRIHRMVAEKGLFTKHGYSEKRVVGDVRFRLQAALSNAGLLGSAYSGALMRQLAAPLPSAMAPSHNWGKGPS
jgi:hypothetical protein